MPALTREIIQAAENIPAELKTDLLSLFDRIDEKEGELENLRQKAPTDADEVVKKTDVAKFRAATTELEQLKLELAQKSRTTGNEGEGFDPFDLFRF